MWRTNARCALPCLLLSTAFSPAARAQPARVPLQTVEQVRSLSSEQANAAQPVHLRGTVMLLPGWRNSFFFSDGRFGIDVDRENPLPRLHSGDTVDLDGVTDAGKFAPLISARQVRVTGHHALPRPRPIGSEDMRNGRQDSQWVSIHGLVRSAQIDARGETTQLVLSVDLGGGTLIAARVLHFPSNAPALLDGATVRIGGVCASAFNTRGQFIAPGLYVEDLSTVHVEHAAANPFALPVVPLASLLRFTSKPSAMGRIHVQGIVTAVQPGSGFYLQQSTQAVFVETDQQTPVSVGMSVQAIGYPKVASYSPAVVNASFLPAPPQQPVQVPVVSADTLLPTLDGYITSPYDSLLIRVTGTLVQTVPGSDADLLLIKSDNGVLLTAKSPVIKGVHVSPGVGSLVALTGICSTVTNDAHDAHDVTLLLRSGKDIQVLRAAPWWAGVRAWYLVLALVVLLLALLAWATFIRRQARLYDLVTRDALTGLYNRRGFLLMAERQWEQASRRNQQMLLFYIDLDNFKQINDTLGHKQGDIALQTTSTVLRECFRKSDVIGRLGGDEFAITALDTPDHSEETMRRRLQQALKLANLNHQHAYNIALSVGVLPCDERYANQPIEELLAHADTLMYEQKRAGRLGNGTAATHRSSAQHAILLPRSS